MSFRLVFTEEAGANIEELEQDAGLAKRVKAVRRALGLLETNPRHPSLQTHQFKSLTGSRGEKVFETYAEQATPAAYRLFWHYVPGKGVITIIAVTPHP